jgi:mannose-1-phosphate guanylyltransferase / mannose-6-phosphate isomerase
MTAPARAILPVILCGGAGTRLWPVSTTAAPKPFHRLLADESLFQQAIRRVADPGAGFLPPVIVCGRAHRGLVEAQLREMAVAPSAIVLEPCGRGTAPIAAIAAAIGQRQTPDALVLLLAADHLIPDGAAFREAVVRGAAVADDRIVVLGIAPTRPEIGYGYIKQGKRLAERLHVVDRFIEKPPAAEAERFVASGEYSWNASAFLFAAGLMLEELRASRPDIAEAALGALPPQNRGVVIALDEARFRLCPAEAIDRAVMEHTSRAAVVLCDFAWADIGAWDEVWRLSDVDERGNSLHGDVHPVDAAGCLIWSEAPTVAAIGVSDLIIVATPSGVLVAPRSRAQEVRALAESLGLRPSTDA